MSHMCFLGIWQRRLPEEPPWCAGVAFWDPDAEGQIFSDLKSASQSSWFIPEKGTPRFLGFFPSNDIATSSNNIFRAFWQKLDPFRAECYCHSSSGDGERLSVFRQWDADPLAKLGLNLRVSSKPHCLAEIPPRTRLNFSSSAKKVQINLV